MTARIDVKKIVSENPKVDNQQLAEVLKLLEELRKTGVRGAEYDLSHPFRQHSYVVSAEEKEEPRVVRSRR